MNINLDYKITFNKEEKIKVPDARELTFEYIMQAVMQKYEKGIEGSLRRLWGRIQRKFDTAIDAKADTVELEQAEQDFIKEAFMEAKFSPIAAKYVQILEDEIESWSKKQPVA